VRVVCFHSDLCPATEAWVRASAPRAEFADTSGSGMAYWEAVKARWGGADSLLFIEHDVLGNDYTIDLMAACAEDWCTAPYDPPPLEFTRGTGCTKFSARVQNTVPAEAFKTTWQPLSMAIADAVEAAGFPVHVHPPVRHLHGWRNHPERWR
jgi:hypothetical protein